MFKNKTPLMALKSAIRGVLFLNRLFIYNLNIIEDFTSRLEVLEYGRKAAAHYGQIRAELEKKGTPIGVNDLHIAGHARSEGLILVTNNVREFERVVSLRIENWVTRLSTKAKFAA